MNTYVQERISFGSWTWHLDLEVGNISRSVEENTWNFPIECEPNGLLHRDGGDAEVVEYIPLASGGVLLA